MTQYYVGVKVVMAWPAKADKDYGGHKAGEDGYAVKYEDGYQSWSPKDVFEAAYFPLGNDHEWGTHVERLIREKAKKYSELPHTNVEAGIR